MFMYRKTSVSSDLRDHLQFVRSVPSNSYGYKYAREGSIDHRCVGGGVLTLSMEHVGGHGDGPPPASFSPRDMGFLWLDLILDADSCLQGAVRLRLICLPRSLPYSGARVGWRLRRFLVAAFLS